MLSGIEPSSVILYHTSFKELKVVLHKQVEAKKDGVINP